MVGGERAEQTHAIGRSAEGAHTRVSRCSPKTLTLQYPDAGRRSNWGPNEYVMHESHPHLVGPGQPAHHANAHVHATNQGGREKIFVVDPGKAGK